MHHNWYILMHFIYGKVYSLLKLTSKRVLFVVLDDQECVWRHFLSNFHGGGLSGGTSAYPSLEDPYSKGALTIHSFPKDHGSFRNNLLCSRESRTLLFITKSRKIVFHESLKNGKWCFSSQSNFIFKKFIILFKNVFNLYSVHRRYLSTILHAIYHSWKHHSFPHRQSPPYFLSISVRLALPQGLRNVQKSAKIVDCVPRAAW